MPRNDIQKQGRILMLPVDCIEPSPYQARTAFDEPEIAALAVSILQNGLLQPISVRRVGLHKYQLVATKNAMLFYKKHSINRSFGEEKSFALMFNFSRCYNGFFAIFPPFRG